MACFRSITRHCRFFSTTAITASSKTTITAAATENINLQHELPDSSVKTLTQSSQFPDIETLKKNPKITQESYVASLIRSRTLSGKHDHALHLYNQMEDLGTPRSVLSFNALLSSYNMSGKKDQVPKVFDEIPQKYGVSPNKVSYAILINSLCNSDAPGSKESASLILKAMEAKNIEVNANTCNALLELLYKKGEVEEAEKIWKEMIERGVSADVAAYNVRIGHASRGKPENVLAIIDEMRMNGLKPDTYTYNYLFTCYDENGMVEEARKVYLDFEKNGCLPNGATFRMSISQFCKNGDFEMAYGVFKESVEMDKIPAFRVLKKLVEGLVEMSKRSEAKDMIRILREKFPDRFYNDWNKIEAALGLKD